MKRQDLSVVIAAANDQEVIEDCLKSVPWIEDVIVVLADTSSDKTKEIAKRYSNKIFTTKNNLGFQRNFGINHVDGEWILILDTDERVSSSLQKEIKNVIEQSKYNGYFIPYRNYFLEHPVTHGNQNYKKIRLFRKNKGFVENLKTHPEIIVKGEIGILQGTLEHYSFRSIPQVVKKFTYYAKEDIHRLKEVEKPNFYKLFLYPLHMFWVIFVEDEGYKDGIWGFGLALCFAYYEFMRYWFLWLESTRRK